MNNVTNDYLRRGFFGKVGYGNKPCILVVDLNKGFTCPSTPLGADLSNVIDNVNKLLKAARPKDIEVIFTVIAYNNKEEIGNWYKKMPSMDCLRIGTGLEEVDERLDKRDNDIVITKKFGSSFFGTNLNHYLASKSIDTLIITGTSTSGCIRATAIDTLQYGYRGIIPEECVGDRAPEPHEANLFDINAKYCDVVSLEEVLNYINTL
jgi:nicotinamidase-related amidase